jgi:uncharacterized iron-regulated membrane protein
VSFTIVANAIAMAVIAVLAAVYWWGRRHQDRGR